MTDPLQSARLAGITMLLVITIVMLWAMFAQSPPHPPAAIPLFALGPFFGASLGLGAAALILTLCRAPGAGLLAVLFAVTGILSFGPQKYTDPSFPLIWPSVVTAQGAILAILASVLPARLVGADRARVS